MAEYIEKEAFITRYRELYCKDCNRRMGIKNGKLRVLYEIGDAPCRACGIDDMLDAVEDFPAANVRENVKGEWIGTGAVEYTMKCKGCSVCGTIRVIDNFCSNCGADMRGEEDGK